MAKTKYFAIDAGFFPDILYLCFGDDALQQLFDDHKLATGIHAFDKGEAETITIHTHLGHLIVMVFDLANYELDEDDSFWVGVISHEVSHAVEKLGHFIGEENLAGETRAYLTQSVVEQVYSASLIERAEIARKRDRKLSNKKGKGKAGDVPKVDIDSNGGMRSNSDTSEYDPIGRIKNGKGKSESKTEDNVSTIRTTRVSGRRNQK